MGISQVHTRWPGLNNKTPLDELAVHLQTYWSGSFNSLSPPIILLWTGMVRGTKRSMVNYCFYCLQQHSSKYILDSLLLQFREKKGVMLSFFSQHWFSRTSTSYQYYILFMSSSRSNLVLFQTYNCSACPYSLKINNIIFKKWFHI